MNSTHFWGTNKYENVSKDLVPLATIRMPLQHPQSQSADDALGEYGQEVKREYGPEKKQIFVDLFVTKADKGLGPKLFIACPSPF